MIADAPHCLVEYGGAVDVDVDGVHVSGFRLEIQDAGCRMVCQIIFS